MFGLANPIAQGKLCFRDARTGPMWWFGRQKRREIWEEPLAEPLGDIEAAQRIREICRSAADSAERVGGSAAASGKTQSDAKKKQDSERYQRAARAAMHIAMKMSDDLMRDASVNQIISLCMKAHDLRTSRILLRAIQSESIKSDVINEHPILRE
jgi:hypothetical protein